MFDVERTLKGDPLFGLRQLSDIALRALSPSLNDPTTAIEALQQTHDLLRRLCVRPFPCGQVHDDAGNLRAVVPMPDFGDALNVGLREVAAAASSARVRDAVRRILDDLATVARPEHLAHLRACHFVDGEVDPHAA